eukprot:TRINITY_DN3065_c0_g1_i2.p1 TRINITY_DN3065_c0_g1~~TRINITY_DN3065_c0_g1_i2.p1  ORF type:complete len:520 (-),score=97.07 TRINITY_DN3065_c0_g1_i2:98-1483(-)
MNLVRILNNFKFFYDKTEWKIFNPSLNIVFLDYFNNKGKTFSFNMGGSRNTIWTCSPKNLRYALHDNFANYERVSLNLILFKDFLGDGIFNSIGLNWKFQRGISSPFFTAKSIKENMMHVFQRHCKDLLNELELACLSKKDIDMQNLFRRFTLRSICNIALGIDKLENEDEFSLAFDNLQREIDRREINPFWKLFPNQKNYENNIKIVNDTMKRVFEIRKKFGDLTEKKDFLSKISLMKDKEGNPLSFTFLRDIALNFMIAGRDTTSQLLTWALYCLSQNQQAYSKVVEEIEQCIPENQEQEESVWENVRNLQKLKYMKSVIQETLRLFPPVPLEGREAKNDDVLPDGTFIAKGSVVTYAAIINHKVKKYWGEDSTKFVPERWEGERKKTIKPYAFLSFHGGDQLCLGQVMAIYQSKNCLANILSKYKFNLSPNSHVIPQRGLTLEAKGGILFHVSKRDSN